MREGERERHTFKGKGELYNMPQYPTIPPKLPRTGVTFHTTERKKERNKEKREIPKVLEKGKLQILVNQADNRRTKEA